MDGACTYIFITIEESVLSCKIYFALSVCLIVMMKTLLLPGTIGGNNSFCTIIKEISTSPLLKAIFGKLLLLHNN